MMNVYLTLLLLSIGSATFINPRECKCEHTIYYYAGKDSTLIAVDACNLPMMQEADLNDDTYVYVLVQSCKGKGLMQFYRYGQLIEERHYKNAEKLKKHTVHYYTLDGEIVEDTIEYSYYPTYKKQQYK
jgi:hypothetical protein